MEIIPVIDVQGGVAVRAVAGERERYGALETPLAEGCDPVAVARGYAALHPFSTLYVADLDGIEGRGANVEMQRRVAEAWGGRDVWVDDGGLGGEGPHARIRKVTGSEALLAAGVCRMLPGSGALAGSGILSLDFRGDAFIGPHGVLAEPTLWPERVIVMTLAAVGRNEGPELKRVADIVRRAGSARHVFAAGGVRGIEDVRALRDAGAAGVLIASALHQGKIRTGDLEEIAGF